MPFIHPLLCQLTGLGELSVCLFVTDRSTFIGSTYLNQDLRTFDMDIFTYCASLSEDVHEQQKNEIQHLFHNGESHLLVCC